MQDATPYQYLPLPAKCALEYLDAQGYGHRSVAKLDEYLAHYYKVYGVRLDEQVRHACHHIAVRRFSLTGEDAVSKVDGSAS